MIRTVVVDGTALALSALFAWWVYLLFIQSDMAMESSGWGLVVGIAMVFGLAAAAFPARHRAQRLVRFGVVALVMGGLVIFGLGLLLGVMGAI